MKNYSLIIVIVLLFFACKKDSNTTNKTTPEKPLSIAEKIAKAHGFSKWHNVSEIAFTFNVDRKTAHFERSYIWQPKTKMVTAINGEIKQNYSRKKVDSLSLRSDQAFINDKFWLFPAFQLVWDSNTKISKPIKEAAPISKTELNKITLTYSSFGGYTPGDAYDIYYDEDFKIKEWIFRKNNVKEPSMITAFSDYKTIKGISFPTKSTKANEDWSLYFTDIKIKTE